MAGPIGTFFKGPLSSKNGLVVGTSGSTLALVEKSITASVVVPAVAAASQADIAVTYADAQPGDVIVVSPADAAMEAGLVIGGAWCAVAGTVKVRVANLKGAAALTGSTTNWSLLLVR